MIRKFTLLLLSVITIQAWSQQDGYQTHFQFNEMSYNPSYAGKVKDKMCVSFLVHDQYVGFKSDLIKNADGKSEVEPYPINATTQYMNISARLFQKLGISVNIIHDKIGPQTFILPKLSLAYYQIFKNLSELSFGLYYGKMQKSLDGTKLKALSVLQNGQVDPAVPNGMVVGNLMNDLGVGLHYFNQTGIAGGSLYNINIGISTDHLIQAKIYAKSTPGLASPFSSITSHDYANASVEFDLGSEGIWSCQPNILVKYGAKMQIDLNALIIYQQQFYGGLSYRQGDNINLMLGFMQGDFKVGYAFDFVVNGLKPGSQTTHELFVQYCKGIKIKPKTQRYMLNPRHLKDNDF